VSDGLDSLPAPQVAFVSYRRGREPELGLTRRTDEIGGQALLAGLEGFPPRGGTVLQLCCRTGMWLHVLGEHAHLVTAVDPSPGDLKVAAWRIRNKPVRDRVRLVASDIFDFEPDQFYDVVFFAAVLSYVPPRRFERFWNLVARCLKPGGRAFFIDELAPGHGEELPEALIPAMQQFLKTDERYRAIKVFYEPDELESRLAHLGWSVEIEQETPRLFYAAATRAAAA